MTSPVQPVLVLQAPVELAADPTGSYPAGVSYWNTALSAYRFYDGSAWHSVGTAGGSGTPTVLATAATWSLPALTQTLIKRKVTGAAGARIVGGAGAVLQGVH